MRISASPPTDISRFSAFLSSAGVCLTNAMARTEGDFEKGEADGTTATLAVATAVRIRRGSSCGEAWGLFCC